jgi:nucleotide-binding universal stress UspA family protein
MKVLVATDGSEHSLKAVRWALDLAQKSDAKVTLLAVALFTKDLGGMMYEMPPGMQEKIESTAQQDLDNASALFTKKGVPVETLLEVGQVPANNIIERAEKGGFDLIVMGSTGVTGLKRAIMGSTASKVVAYAPCSVTIIR